MKPFLYIKHLLNKFGYDIRYHRPFFETMVYPLGITTILDIGANDGNFAKDMAARFPKATIHSFEPLADCYARLETLSKEIPQIIPHNYALGAEGGETEIERNSFHPSSSLLPMTRLHETLYPKARGTVKERIAIARLDEVAQDLSLSDPLFVKIDVQGFERDVIRGGSATLKKASLIVVETSYLPLYESAPLFHETVALLAALGQSYMGAYQVHHSNRTGRPIYEDAVFVSENVRATFEQEEITRAVQS